MTAEERTATVKTAERAESCPEQAASQNVATDPRQWGPRQIVIADGNLAFLQLMLDRKIVIEYSDAGRAEAPSASPPTGKDKRGAKSDQPDAGELKEWMQLIQKERDSIVELHKLVMAAESAKAAKLAGDAVESFVQALHSAATPEQMAIIDELVEKIVHAQT